MKPIYLLTALLICYSTSRASNPDWGKTGHRTVGEIAESYLKNKTKRKISALLNGHGLAYIATFGDDIKSDKQYNKFYTWHFVNMPLDVKYQDSEKNSEGDVVTGIEKCKAMLIDPNTTKEEKVFYLKLLVHFIGDLHQPMHVGRKEDRGGNDVKVKWFGSKTNLHSVWDSKMLDSYDMTYTELANNTDKLSKVQVQNLQKGTIIDWVNDTHINAVTAYKSVENNRDLAYSYNYKYLAMARTQLQKGGIRLAKVLNDLFK